MAEQRYTLTLPGELYDELRSLAEKHNLSIKEVVRQSLKFGLVAMKVAEDPKRDLYIREKVTTPSGEIDRDVQLQFVW